MQMSRAGLHEVKTGSITRNSPLVCGFKNAHTPLKALNAQSAEQRLISKDLSSVGKENVGLQAVVEVEYKQVQTDVSVCEVEPELIAEDLMAEEPTINYLRVVAQKLENENEDELNRSLKLLSDIAEANEERRDVEDQIETIKAVIVEINIGTGDENTVNN